MITRQRFINKIRSLDYSFKSRQKRTDLWRKKGGTHYISMPLSELLEDEFVISSLRQAGCEAEEIKRFLAAAKS